MEKLAKLVTHNNNVFEDNLVHGSKVPKNGLYRVVKSINANFQNISFVLSEW